jgi:NADPH:quinone reductase-like Zn-dependent oxidoreductase
VIVVEEIVRPAPGEGEVLVRVAASGVAPWDAIIREGKSKVSPPPPLTLGSDLSGTVEGVGTGTAAFQIGDEVYGVTNPGFCGANAEYALALASMIAHKPKSLSHIEAASAPVVAVTAWQMLFEYAKVSAGQSILILGAAGSVGADAVQLAVNGGLRVFATGGPGDAEYVKSLGAEKFVDTKSGQLVDPLPTVDAVIDLVGGDTAERAVRLVKPGGILVSVVSSGGAPERTGVKSVFFYAEVTTARLNRISELFDQGRLVTKVGTVLPLEGIRSAHEMLAGAPHERGKIVLRNQDAR